MGQTRTDCWEKEATTRISKGLPSHTGLLLPDVVAAFVKGWEQIQQQANGFCPKGGKGLKRKTNEPNIKKTNSPCPYREGTGLTVYWLLDFLIMYFWLIVLLVIGCRCLRLPEINLCDIGRSAKLKTNQQMHQ